MCNYYGCYYIIIFSRMSLNYWRLLNVDLCEVLSSSDLRLRTAEMEFYRFYIVSFSCEIRFNVFRATCAMSIRWADLYEDKININFAKRWRLV